MTEQIEWISVSERLPDDEQTVLIHMTDADEPVWIGYFVRGDYTSYWRDAASGGLAEDVTHWCEMPAGPRD